jgi:phage N-6-adenine-methyltransferase
MKTEHAERIYGRLHEAAHISGYAFEHLCKELETLIDTNQWQTIEPGYTDFTNFIRTIDLSQFNFDKPKRKRLAKKMSKAGASARAIADSIGVHRSTIERDLNGGNAPPTGKTTTEKHTVTGANAPPDNMSIHYSSETDEWATPEILFKVLNAEFKFTLDVCATKKNAKCRRYFTEADDGLAKRWTGRCWMNPPYGDQIGKWIAKAYEAGKEGATVVCLIPARVDTGWWWDYCRFGQMRFLRGRLKFGNGDNSAPFPSVVVIFPRKPRVIWWEGWNGK